MAICVALKVMLLLKKKCFQQGKTTTDFGSCDFCGKANSLFPDQDK